MLKTSPMDAKEKLVTLLRSIGLNQYEAQAYASLLLFGMATAGELSNRAEIPRPRVYDIISRLEKKGFVVVQPGRPVKYKAVPPREAIQAYLRLKEEEFKKEKERIANLAKELERESASRKVREEEGGFWVLNTDNLLRSRLQTLISSSTNEIIAALTPEFLAEYGNTLIPIIQDAATKGVRIRLVVPRGLAGTFTIEGDVDIVESDVDIPPTIIVDNKAAIIAMPTSKQAILVDHPEFSRTFRRLLENHIDFV